MLMIYQYISISSSFFFLAAYLFILPSLHQSKRSITLQLHPPPHPHYTPAPSYSPPSALSVPHPHSHSSRLQNHLESVSHSHPSTKLNTMYPPHKPHHENKIDTRDKRTLPFHTTHTNSLPPSPSLLDTLTIPNLLGGRDALGIRRVGGLGWVLVCEAG